MSSMISVEEALKRVLASAETPLEEEKVALPAAYGRVLAHDLKALRTQPPFPNSAMDGYAHPLRGYSFCARDPQIGRRIRRGPRLRGSRRSGRGGAHLHRRAHADGADTIVIQEDVSREGELIRLSTDRADRGQSAPGRHGLSVRPNPHRSWLSTRPPGCRAGGGRKPHRT